MQFNVPQFIDIEDKIVGPLTAKQLGWLALGGLAALITWNLLDFGAFVIAVIFIGMIFGGLAFYRPYGQPLVKFLTSSVFFVSRPKMYVWRRGTEKMRSEIRKKETVVKAPQKKTITSQKLQEISSLLDQEK